MSITTFEYGSSATEIIKAIEKDGGVVIKNVLTKQQLCELDNTSHTLLNHTKDCDGIFHGYKTKRVGGMIGKSKVCQDVTINPTILDIMDHFLLPNCTDYQLNLSQLIAIGPGERQQVIHADDPMFPVEFKNAPLMINVMWAIDDFTKENGATHIALGSHLWPRDRQPEENEIVQGEMSAGSCMIWLGSSRHGGGANMSPKARRGVVISYCLGWLRQSENQYLAIPMELAKTYPEPLQRLIGYFVHKPNLGMVDGDDPIKLLNDNSVKSKTGFKDFMPDHIEELLKQHYEGKKVAVA